jgi:hypothetical protein
MQSVIPDLVSEERAESVGNPGLGLEATKPVGLKNYGPGQGKFIAAAERTNH